MRITAFGFRYGKCNADIVVDLRRLIKNPDHDKTLRKLTGLDKPVVDEVLGFQPVQEAIDDLIRRIEQERPEHVAIGCTGGRHRSVAVAREVARRLDLPEPFLRDRAEWRVY